ncbi:hypothetical protein PG994_012579 [Apiospora phragmitis]|uniref:Uncharacterized protein n=1 Tax=Apiospora phragmitis TaxID=2905665 RepID=A0ABR1TAU9_9PEZI
MFSLEVEENILLVNRQKIPEHKDNARKQTYCFATATGRSLTSHCFQQQHILELKGDVSFDSVYYGLWCNCHRLIPRLTFDEDLEGKMACSVYAAGCTRWHSGWSMGPPLPRNACHRMTPEVFSVEPSSRAPMVGPILGCEH